MGDERADTTRPQSTKGREERVEATSRACPPGETAWDAVGEWVLRRGSDTVVVPGRRELLPYPTACKGGGRPGNYKSPIQTLEKMTAGWLFRSTCFLRDVGLGAKARRFWTR